MIYSICTSVFPLNSCKTASAKTLHFALTFALPKVNNFYEKAIIKLKTFLQIFCYVSIHISPTLFFRKKSCFKTFQINLDSRDHEKATNYKVLSITLDNAGTLT